MQYVVDDREGIVAREATEREGGSAAEDVVEATGPFDVAVPFFKLGLGLLTF
jgi:hypothetical protein